MGAILNLVDKLTNVMSGRGTSIDRAMYNRYSFIAVDPSQAEAAYRDSWLMRKIIDLPPDDMTRAWRAWQTDKDNIEKLEAEERRLQVKAKCKRALILARLWGGGAIVIGNGDADSMEPLKPGTSAGSLRYLNVYSRYQLTAGPEITDPVSEWCGQPEKFKLMSQGRPLDIHPSRVVAFVGQRMPEGTLISGADWFWGDPLYQSIRTALQNADLAQDGFAALIDEAKVDIIKIPDMMANVGTDEYTERFLARLSAAAQGKSTWRMMAIDGAEEWEQRQITWAGMPDIITSYLQIVAGAADIPITRLLGQSPKGLQSTGDGEERDYHAMIAGKQDEMLAPALDRIDALLIPSALGSRPSDVWYSFNTLERLSPKDAAEIQGKFATAFKTLVDTGNFENEAMSEIGKNYMIESGFFPGAEAAFEAAEKTGAVAPFAEEPDPNDLLTAEEIAAQTAKGGGDPASQGGGGKPPARTAKPTKGAAKAGA